MQATVDQYFDLKRLSEYSSLAVPTLRDYLRGGGLPHFKLRGKVLVRRSEFDRWVEKFRVDAEQDIAGAVDDILKSLKSN